MLLECDGRYIIFRNALIAALMVLFISLAFAGDIITVSGKFSDAYSNKIHIYVEDKFMEIENVPKDVMKRIRKVNREKIITLKIKKVDGKYIFLSMEKEK